jgi:hypothetical protein
MKSIVRLSATLTASLAIASGSASATIPDANGVYWACVEKGEGEVRLIDYNGLVPPPVSRCERGETLVWWNLKGQKGDTGATGATGPQGLKGDPGLAGPQGQKGDTGATGATGTRGPTGPAGPAGQQGQKGNTGATGAMGPRGPMGPQGPQGPAGREFLFCGVTSAMRGNLSGYPGAKNLCATACGNTSARMCRAADMIASEDVGRVPAVSAWYSTGTYASDMHFWEVVPVTSLPGRTHFTSDCFGWTSSTGSNVRSNLGVLDPLTDTEHYYGPVWVPGSGPNRDQCNREHAVACCAPSGN